MATSFLLDPPSDLSSLEHDNKVPVTSSGATAYRMLFLINMLIWSEYFIVKGKNEQLDCENLRLWADNFVFAAKLLS